MLQNALQDASLDLDFEEMHFLGSREPQFAKVWFLGTLILYKSDSNEVMLYLNG